MGMYAESRESLNQSPDCGLKTRLQFHLAHKFKEEEALVQYAELLSGEVEDQLSHAAVNYLRNHFQEATDIYKRLVRAAPTPAREVQGWRDGGGAAGRPRCWLLRCAAVFVACSCSRIGSSSR